MDKHEPANPLTVEYAKVAALAFKEIEILRTAIDTADTKLYALLNKLPRYYDEERALVHEIRRLLRAARGQEAS